MGRDSFCLKQSFNVFVFKGKRIAVVSNQEEENSEKSGSQRKLSNHTDNHLFTLSYGLDNFDGKHLPTPDEQNTRF